jgi:putative membrane protein
LRGKCWEESLFKGALKDELFTPTKGLAANQGLYNGFLCSGINLVFADF